MAVGSSLSSDTILIRKQSEESVESVQKKRKVTGGAEGFAEKEGLNLE